MSATRYLVLALKPVSDVVAVRSSAGALVQRMSGICFSVGTTLQIYESCGTYHQHIVAPTRQISFIKAVQTSQLGSLASPGAMTPSTHVDVINTTLRFGQMCPVGILRVTRRGTLLD